MSWQETLFRILWEETDFDDHPVDTCHSPEPMGRLRFSLDGSLSLRDDRIRFLICGSPSSIPAQGEGPVHVLSTHPREMSPQPGRKGIHRWSLHLGMLPDEILEAAPFRPLAEDASWDQDLDTDAPVILPDWPQDESLSTAHHPRIEWSDTIADWQGPTTHVAGFRYLLSRLRNRLSANLVGWTWSLEVDNKSDRTGWYIRAPAGLHSLFTIFIGMGWQPGEGGIARGFLLFERTPPGELDWPSEAPQNAHDAERTPMVRAVLSIPEVEGDHWLPDEELNLWPLLMSRAPEGYSLESLCEWFADLLDHLEKPLWVIRTR